MVPLGSRTGRHLLTRSRTKLSPPRGVDYKRYWLSTKRFPITSDTSVAAIPSPTGNYKSVPDHARNVGGGAWAPRLTPRTSSKTQTGR